MLGINKMEDMSMNMNSFSMSMQLRDNNSSVNIFQAYAVFRFKLELAPVFSKTEKRTVIYYIALADGSVKMHSEQSYFPESLVACYKKAVGIKDVYIMPRRLERIHAF